MLALKGIGDPVDDALIKVIATELGVAVGGFHIKDAVGDPQQRHIKRSPTKVEHQHPSNGAAVEAVGQGSGGGFVEDPFHGDSGQPARIPGGLTLRVIEVGGHGHHSSLHRLAEVGAGVIDQFADDAGHQLFRCIFPLSDGTGHPHLPPFVGSHRVRHRQAAVLQLVPVATDEPFEVGKRVAWTQHELTACELTDQKLLLLGVTDHGGGGPATFGIGDDMGSPRLQHSNDRIRCPQIDSDDPPHSREHWFSTLTGGSRLSE